jgi:predicted RNA-binding protein with PIN domain
MPDDEERLIELLIEYSRVVKKKIIVYFDNAPLNAAGVKKFGLVNAFFVREGISADAAIRARLGQLGKEARNWTVVSSDHEIQRDVQYAGAMSMLSEEFARMIVDKLNKVGENMDESPEEYPDEVEAKRWLELFKRGLDDREH